MGNEWKYGDLNPRPPRNQSSDTMLDHQLSPKLKLLAIGANIVYQAIQDKKTEISPKNNVVTRISKG